MGCSSCGSEASGGCKNTGACATGGCNKMNTYDWISVLDIHDPSAFNLVEVSFKKGARKDFYINQEYTHAVTGDYVVVESDSGLDTGQISLSGELVRLQMKKKKVNENKVTRKVIRKANQRDLEKLEEARSLERDTLVRARVIARTLGLEMKIGDIEYQGDKRKATFYYTADGRVDFRELVRSYAKEFKVKVEMRQIGARQESARIGGVGSCGRELCCSTWLSDFKSVNTSAARYQNIAINQTKLSGQCGRLKCCLNYELDAYMDALKDFPEKADTILTAKGKASLIKTDIFKGLMFYTYVDAKFRGPIVALDKERVKEIIALNKKGEKPEDLVDFASIALGEDAESKKEIEFADVTGEIELPNIKKKRRSKRRKKKPSNKSNNSQDLKSSSNNQGAQKTDRADKQDEKGSTGQNKKSSSGESGQGANRNNNRNRNKNRNKRRRPPKSNNGPSSDNKKD